MFQAFGVPAFPVDTHISLNVSMGVIFWENVQDTEKQETIISKRKMEQITSSTIFYGREYCPAKNLIHIIVLLLQ